MRHFAGASLALVSWLFLTPGCSGPELVLATLPSEAGASEVDASEAGAATTQGCAGNSDASNSGCTAGTYCDMPACDATSGACELVPETCDNSEQPMCGCDGITYFNDCLRKANKIPSSTQGPCPFDSAQTCGACGGSCPPGTACAQLHRGCPMNACGVCWALPSQCPQAGAYDSWWNSCVGRGPCVDTCTAIASGGVYQHAMSCP